MIRLRSLVSGFFCVLSLLITSQAAVVTAAPLQQLVATIEINRPAGEVWALLRDFDALRWHPRVKDVQLIRGSNGRIGAVRSVSMRDAPAYSDELVSYQDKAMSYRYRTLTSPWPIDRYEATLSVQPHGKQARVTWRATYVPRPKLIDGSAADVRLILQAQQHDDLQNLKRLAEGS